MDFWIIHSRDSLPWKQLWITNTEEDTVILGVPGNTCPVFDAIVLCQLQELLITEDWLCLPMLVAFQRNITGGMSATQAGHNQPVDVALHLRTQGPLRADLTD